MGSCSNRALPYADSARQPLLKAGSGPTPMSVSAAFESSIKTHSDVIFGSQEKAENGRSRRTLNCKT